MRLRRPLSTGQRVVLVIGTAMALYEVGAYITTLGSGTGWVGYAPLTSPQIPLVGGLHPWIRLVVWLALVVIWVGTSLLLLKPGSDA
jgi:hypothetical protein